MSLLWDYEEKTHRIIAGRKRKKVQKRIVAAVNDGYEVESLTYSDGQYVALLVDTFSVDRARQKEMSRLADEYAARYKEESFEHGLASAVHYIEGLRDLAMGLSGPRLPAYDAYMDGFEQRETPLSDRVGTALTAIIKLECARIVGESEAPKGPYRDRNLTRSQAGAYGQLLSWYYGWYDAKGQEEQPDAGLANNQHYMDAWNLFRKLETQAARRLEYQRNRDRNGIGEVKNPPVTAAVSPAEVERARTENTDPGSEHPIVNPPPSERLAPASHISPVLKDQLESQEYDPESPEGLLYRQGWGWAEQGMPIAQNNKGAFYLGYRAYDEVVRAPNPDQGWKTRYNPGRAPSERMQAKMKERSILLQSMDGWAYQNGWELAEDGADQPETTDHFFMLGFLDYSAPDKPNGMPRSPEELKERIAAFKQEQAEKEADAPVELNIPAPLSVSFSTDNPVPPIPAPDLAPWLAFHNLASGSKEEQSYTHGWNRAAGGIDPIPPGIDEWNDLGYQDWTNQSAPPAAEEDETDEPSVIDQAFSKHSFSSGALVNLSRLNYEHGWSTALNNEEIDGGAPTTAKCGFDDATELVRAGKLKMAFDTEPQDPPPSDKGNDSGAKEHPSTVEDGMRIHGMHSESSGGKVYREAWGIAMSGEYPAHSSFQYLLSQDVMPFFAQQGWKDGRRVYESENSEQPNPEPQSPSPTDNEGKRDGVGTVEHHLAKRNIPLDSSAATEYKRGWETALDINMRSGNLPDKDVLYRETPSFGLGFGDASELIRLGNLGMTPTPKSESDKPAPQSPPETEEPAEDVPLLAAFGSYRARRNIPPRSGRGNYYRNGWCDAADALQVSMNLPDDPENGLRLAYLAGYNDYQEAVVMSKESA